MAKIIKSFDIDLNSLPASGETRAFTVQGDNGAIFSLEIRNEDGYYYNFSTKTFAATKSRLENKKVNHNGYSGSIAFPKITDNDQYDIYLWAGTAWDTKHVDRSLVRFSDGSVDINSSTGSSSAVIQKVIYQYTDTTITLSAIAPEAARTTTNFSSMSVTTDTIIAGRNTNITSIPFEITVTSAATKAFEIKRQPTSQDVTVSTTAIIGDAVILHGEDIWAGTVRSTDTVDGAVSSATKIVMDNNVASKMKVGDRVTGTGIAASSVITVVALNPDGDNVKEFSVSSAVSVSDGVTLTFTPPHYYRYNVAAASSLHKLTRGMILVDPDSLDAVVPRATIGPYKETTTITTKKLNDDGTMNENERVITTLDVPAIDHLGYRPTIVNGVITKQLGNITFSTQVSNDIDDTNAKTFYGHGTSAINNMHNTEVSFSDLKVELTKPTTTTTSTVSNSTTVGVADREGTVQNVSTISGIGIAPGATNPTVTSATADGAGNWTISVAQTLEDGITLTVENTSRVAVITGNIELLNINDSNFTIYFDVEKFLTAS